MLLLFVVDCLDTTTKIQIYDVVMKFFWVLNTFLEEIFPRKQ